MGAFHLMMPTTHPEHFRVAPDLDPAIEEGAQLGAGLCRESWERRRLMARVYLV
jgi:hypothetical protein